MPAPGTFGGAREPPGLAGRGHATIPAAGSDLPPPVSPPHKDASARTDGRRYIPGFHDQGMPASWAHRTGDAKTDPAPAGPGIDALHLSAGARSRASSRCAGGTVHSPAGSTLLTGHSRRARPSSARLFLGQVSHLPCSERPIAPLMARLEVPSLALLTTPPRAPVIAAARGCIAAALAAAPCERASGGTRTCVRPHTTRPSFTSPPSWSSVHPRVPAQPALTDALLS